MSPPGLYSVKEGVIMGFEGFPFIVGWELTLACNLHCRHCGSSASQPRAGELTSEEALAICDQFPELIVQEVNFTGGEPLLRPDWYRIAAYLGELGIITKMLFDKIRCYSLAKFDIVYNGIEFFTVWHLFDHFYSFLLIPAMRWRLVYREP